MDRRSFLRRSAVVAAGLIAADQLEILEQLTHKRTLFPGHRFEAGRIYIDMGRDTWIYEGPADGLFSDSKLIELGVDPAVLDAEKFYAQYKNDPSAWLVDFKDTDNFQWRSRGSQRG